MIRKLLDLSTAHVSPAAREWLNDTGALNADTTTSGGSHTVALTYFGWFVRVHCEDFADTAMHPDLKPVMVYAKAQGCDFVLFDSDADQIDGLPAFDW